MVKTFIDLYRSYSDTQHTMASIMGWVWKTEERVGRSSNNNNNNNNKK